LCKNYPFRIETNKPLNFSDSIDIEQGVTSSDPTNPKSVPFKYKKLRSKASIHYHSGPDKRSLNSSMDDAQEPLISGTNLEQFPGEMLLIYA